MASLVRRGLGNFMAMLGGTTILSGLWLYWRFTGGFGWAEISTHGGLAFGIGGLAGLVGAAIGGGVVGRSAMRAVALAQQAAAAVDAERTSLLQTAMALRQRAAAASRIVLVLLVLATILMGVGRYV